MFEPTGSSGVAVSCVSLSYILMVNSFFRPDNRILWMIFLRDPRRPVELTLQTLRWHWKTVVRQCHKKAFPILIYRI